MKSGNSPKRDKDHNSPDDFNPTQIAGKFYNNIVKDTAKHLMVFLSNHSVSSRCGHDIL